MSNFPHLPLPLKIIGPALLRGGGGASTRTIQNRANRLVHGRNLQASVRVTQQTWEAIQVQRNKEGLPSPPDGIPVFLQIDTQVLTLEKLKGFGIHIISENEDGYIVGASVDNFQSLSQKIERFLEGEAVPRKDANQAAQFWSIASGINWRPEQVLSPELFAKWGDINEEDYYIVDVGVACHIHIPETLPEDVREASISNRQRQIQEAQEKRENLEIELEDKLTEYVNQYNGALLSSFIQFDDSFCCRIRISGAGLKDLVFTFSYIFDISEPNLLLNLPFSIGEGTSIDCELKTVSPEPDAPSICIIDSGLQEEHVLLNQSIVRTASKSYVLGELSTADYVTNGGHGTKVAGAVQFPKGPAFAGEYRLPFWLYNARILDSDARFDETVLPAEVTKSIVDNFHINYGVRLFNLSVAETVPFRPRHMTLWAGEIDKLTFEHDIQFIVAAGNLPSSSGESLLPSIQDFLNSGNRYPEYLLDDGCKIANPAHSLNSITVGSVCYEQFVEPGGYRKSFGDTSELSSFSRTGLGIWDTIKPEVVEYGGDLIYDSSNIISNCEETSPILICSTMDGQSAIRKNQVGTSFTAPMVTSILGEIQRTLPSYTTLLYRALLVQSAQWPAYAESNGNQLQNLRFLGYGIPDVSRATSNTDYRITLFAEQQIAAKEAYIYTIPIPDTLRNPAQNYRIRLEVTLAYKALPRLTRRKLKSYLSTWLHWESSKLGESYENFKARLIRAMQVDENDLDSAVPASEFNSIPWVIGRQVNSGTSDVRLTNSTVQKDWADIESHNLPEEISIAVVGHNGWQKDLKFKVPYAITVSFTALDEDYEIYEEIRQEIEVQQQVRV